MRYYSDLTHRFYETEELCKEAEVKHLKDIESKEKEKQRLLELRKVRTEELEKAHDEFLAARKKYNELLTKFCNDFGPYHSIKDIDSNSTGVFSILFPDRLLF